MIPDFPYADILALPHHVSPRHAPMPLEKRAAQFAPFAALSGYDDMIIEEARATEAETSQDAEMLNMKFMMISQQLDSGTNPSLTFRVFVPDALKDGGQYVNVTGSVVKIDAINKQVVLEDRRIDMSAIHDIYGEAVDGLDEGMA